ncbi:hypothetical protein ACMD2_07898 [Ananas comosus]|uniref:Protein PLASTID REDOX INSENSITIVE 2, chloroplastic-like n=1 Tax=Ananas comosus TaxID=4615 RepID=A0A199UID3_ANACO|nr:hypothetical protein ACMD2_07898 [Ananas comosus]
MVATGLGGAAALSPLLLLPTCRSNKCPPSLLPPSSPLLSRSPPLLHGRSSLSSSSSSSSSFQACCLRSPNPSSSSSSLSRTTHHRFFPLQLPLPISSPTSHSTHPHLLCRATEYKFPDPIPEFADAETDKFRTHMLARLTEKNQYFGDFVEEIVDICTEILSNFLHAEYGGPGTLLVIPFIDMADTIREKGLPGAPQAARAAVWWAEKHIDKDWKEWTGDRD